MMIKNRKFPWWKLIATWALFLLLHFSYETFPNTLFKIIGEEGETIYFHMKMLFFAYFFTTLVESILRRRQLSALQNFFTSRMMIATIYPWMTITLFFLAQAITGSMLPMPWEIIWANLVTTVGIYTALHLEQAFDAIEYQPALRWLIWLIFAIALLTYIVFSFVPPDHFFVSPEGLTH